MESELGYLGEPYIILTLYIEHIELTLNLYHEFARPVGRDM